MTTLKKIVIAGGSGQVGRALIKSVKSPTTQIIVLSRDSGLKIDGADLVLWNPSSAYTNDAAVVRALNGADLLINLSGKSVNCRYNTANRKEILDSRIRSITALQRALLRVDSIPQLIVQMASATIYRDARDHAMGERNGEIGSGFSVDVCTAWEAHFQSCVNELRRHHAQSTFRSAILRTSLVLSAEAGVLPRFIALCNAGLGGPHGTGDQMMSWIHEEDVWRVIEFLQHSPELEGVFNCTAPYPLANAMFVNALRHRVMQTKRISLARFMALPNPEKILAFGAAVIGTETELLLKSRWVIPERLESHGFAFKFPDLNSALSDLIP